MEVYPTKVTSASGGLGFLEGDYPGTEEKLSGFPFRCYFRSFSFQPQILEQSTEIKSIVLRKLASTRHIDDDVKSETCDNFQQQDEFHSTPEDKFYLPTIRRVGLSTKRNILPVHGQQYARTCLCAARETLNSLSL